MTFPLSDLYFGLMVLFRSSALLLSFPMWGERGLPSMVKVGLVLGVAFAVYPGIQQTTSVLVFPNNAFLMLLVLLKEVLIGILMGMIVRFAFSMVEFAGQLMASEIGLTSSIIFNPLEEHSSSLFSVILFYFMGTLFFITGAHKEIILALAKSYEYAGVGYQWGNIRPLNALIDASTLIFSVGFKLAAPLMTLNFAITFSFAILGKAAPKINVFFISFSVRILMGLLLLSLTVRLIYGYILEALNQLPQRLLQLLQ